jgi:hypothetical protein
VQHLLGCIAHFLRQCLKRVGDGVVRWIRTGQDLSRIFTPCRLRGRVEPSRWLLIRDSWETAYHSQELAEDAPTLRTLNG